MIRKKNILFLFTFLFVISLFSYLFYLSTNYIINYWSFSQSHLNYSHGFVKRGLFGSIALFLEKILTIKFTFLFTYFFIIVSSVNIILYFTLIKKYSFDILIFLFIALSPTLILFPFLKLSNIRSQ